MSPEQKKIAAAPDSHQPPEHYPQLIRLLHHTMRIYRTLMVNDEIDRKVLKILDTYAKA